MRHHLSVWRLTPVEPIQESGCGRILICKTRGLRGFLSQRQVLGLLLALAFLLTGSANLKITAAAESAPHTSGGDLEIRWTLLSNAEDGLSHRARWTITNHGQAPLPASGWTLYFNMLHLAGLEPIIEIPPTVTIRHFSGDMLTLRPTDKFQPIAPGGVFTFEYQGIRPVNKPSWGPDGPLHRF